MFSVTNKSNNLIVVTLYYYKHNPPVIDICAPAVFYRNTLSVVVILYNSVYIERCFFY